MDILEKRTISSPQNNDLLPHTASRLSNSNPPKFPSFRLNSASVPFRGRHIAPADGKAIHDHDQDQNIDIQNYHPGISAVSVKRPVRDDDNQSRASKTDWANSIPSNTRIPWEGRNEPRASTSPERTETARLYPTSTSGWLEEQERNSRNPTTASHPTTAAHFTRDLNSIQSIDERKTSNPPIPPIRSFRSSMNRNSFEMNGRLPQQYRYDGGGRQEEEEDEEDDRDRTLRALEGTDNRSRYSAYNNGRNDRRQASESDLFLSLAQDDFSSGPSTPKTEKRRSRIALPNRNSMPGPPVSYSRQTDGQKEERSQQFARMAPTSIYSRGERSIPTPTQPVGDVPRPRYIGGIPRSSPGTPRISTFNSNSSHSSQFSPNAISPTTTRRYPSLAETATGTSGESGRRTSAAEATRRSSVTEQPRKSSIPETALSIPRTQYRQSNLSYTSPRAYNSSPLVLKTMDTTNEAEAPPPQENTDETESTTSTTAQSTIWDELDDIKQRMRRLEFIGKMPATSGAAISNSSNERPRTATTTVTTNSTSPKRYGGSIASPLDTNTSTIGLSSDEAHPNLKAALAKSKSILNTDLYGALEKTANDALTLSAMTGTIGQPGPISSAQSAVGAGTSGITDRQLRKKADNMCRSLTELCIALNERKAEGSPLNESNNPVRPITREKETSSYRPITREKEASESSNYDVTSTMRKVSDAGSQALARLKASPRALSRLSERRTSLFASSSLPTTPRIPLPTSMPASETSTPNQASSAGRRTSLLLRSNRRAATEEAESSETRDDRFRAPSRAVTEIGQIGRTRNSPREYTSNRPLPEVREPQAQPALPSSSGLPLRRHFISTSLASSLPMAKSGPATPTTPNAVSRLESRRYLERVARQAPDSGSPQDTPPDEERTQKRQSSMGLAYGVGRNPSITRRLRAANGTEP